jgi:hypothetical protein
MIDAIPTYAICHRGTWHVARLVLEVDYDPKRSPYDEPVWADANTTAYICPHSQAETIIRLRHQDN